ncbi:MAG: hypothetical protein HW421_3522 [Ignavibacteria bacterium]|nr:hypothetical protein [Ignavibacteria bacterium]
MKQIIYIIAALAFLIIYTSCEDSLGLEKKVRITPLFEKDTTKPPPPPPPKPIKIHCDSMLVYVVEDMGITQKQATSNKPKEWDKILIKDKSAAILYSDTSKKLLALSLNFQVRTTIPLQKNMEQFRYDWVNSFSLKLDSIQINPDKDKELRPIRFPLNDSEASGYYLGVNIYKKDRTSDTLIKLIEDAYIDIGFETFHLNIYFNLQGKKFLHGKIVAPFAQPINTRKLTADIWIFYH